MSATASTQPVVRSGFGMSAWVSLAAVLIYVGAYVWIRHTCLLTDPHTKERFVVLDETRFNQFAVILYSPVGAIFDEVWGTATPAGASVGSARRIPLF